MVTTLKDLIENKEIVRITVHTMINGRSNERIFDQMFEIFWEEGVAHIKDKHGDLMSLAKHHGMYIRHMTNKQWDNFDET